MHTGWALSWIGGGLGIVALAAAWLVLGPTGLGGSTGYVLVVGSSMEPHLHRGDLVLVRSGGDYRVGDVAAYRSRLLGRIVLHRIVAEHDGSYVFKGDANGFVDPAPVSRSDLIGRYWLKIGGVAPVFLWVRRPWNAALLAGLAGLLAFGTGGGAVATRRRRRRRAVAATPPPALPVRLAWEPLAAAAGLLLLAAGSLAGVALAVPAVRQVAVSRLYSESGVFSYGAHAPAGAAYPDGRVGAGEAVFSSLVHRLDVRFDWRLRTNLPYAVGGTASLAAVVSDGGGWSRRLPLARSRRFAGDRVSVGGVLDLAAIERLLRSLEAATGARVGTYQLALVPTVAVAGTVAGESVHDVFAPPLAFTLDELRLAPVTSVDAAVPNGLTRTRDVAGTLPRRSSLSLLGAHLSLGDARRLAEGEGALSALVLLLALGIRARRGAKDEVARAVARHAASIVEVTEEPAPRRVIDVSTADELARVAERYERLILHHPRTRTLLVEDDGVAYRWREPAAAADRQAAAHPVERRNLATRPWVRARDANAAAAELAP